MSFYWRVGLYLLASFVLAVLCSLSVLRIFGPFDKPVAFLIGFAFGNVFSWVAVLLAVLRGER